MAEKLPFLKWDQVGERGYETGVSKGVLFPYDPIEKEYAEGVVWNGLTAVTESPSGAEASPLYADNIKYLSLTSAEEFGAKIEAYTYPVEFGACDGSEEIATGVLIGQQSHNAFCLVYTTVVGNDQNDAVGEKIHIIYGAKAKPSERAFKTINDKPEAISFSWEVTTTPVAVTGFKPTASIVIDSTKCDANDFAALKEKLYGVAAVAANPTAEPPVEAVTEVTPVLLFPDDIVALFAATANVVG